jgi:hypothetical protein
MAPKRTPKPPFKVAAEVAPGRPWKMHHRPFDLLDQARTFGREWAASHTPPMRVEIYDADVHIIERYPLRMT